MSFIAFISKKHKVKSVWLKVWKTIKITKKFAGIEGSRPDPQLKKLSPNLFWMKHWHLFYTT